MKIARAWRASTAIAVLATASLTVTVADSDPLTVSAAAPFGNRTDMRDWLAERRARPLDSDGQPQMVLRAPHRALPGFRFYELARL
jgi:hypothetical protein